PPLFTARPESKSISDTRPGRSALMVTPCTAATVPIAFSVVFHDSGFAMTVVTASGGACQLCDMAALICMNLKPPTIAMKAMTAASMRSIRLVIGGRQDTRADLICAEPALLAGIRAPLERNMVDREPSRGSIAVTNERFTTCD